MKSRVMPGAEPFSFDGGPTGVLLVHGFTGNPASMRPMGEWLAERGYAVECPLLPGHGTFWRDLADVRWQDWVAEAEAALGRVAGRCESVAVAGLSMGGGLAMLLGARHPDRLRGVVAVNPYLRDRRIALASVYRLFLRSVKGVGDDIKRPRVSELPYPRIPVSAVAQLALQLKEIRLALPSMKLPLLVFNSTSDHVVPKGTADYLMRIVGSGRKELVTLSDSYHVATLDNEAETIFRRTDEFIRSVAGKPAR